MSKVLTLCVALTLVGCATNQTGIVNSFDAQLAALFTKVGAFSLADLQAADVDAKAHSDTVASMCYEAVIPLIQKASSTPPMAPIGVVTAFQDLRDGVNGTNAVQGLLKQLEIPCGPLAADVNLNLVQLIAKFAGIVAPNPLSAVVP